MDSPEVPNFDPQVFDDNFFASYEKQLASISIEDQASVVLAGILTIQKADGTQKSYQQLRDETRAFFSNEMVRNDEAIMNRMTMEFARACMGHDHGSMLAEDNQLGSLFDKGINGLFKDSHDHDDSHSLLTKKEDDDWEIGPDGKKRKKQKHGWLSLAAFSIKRSIFSLN